MNDARIALDVMGGDRAPGSSVGGALLACDGDGPHGIDPARVLLVGEPAAIEAELAERGGNPGFEIRPASQVIEMGESPSKALRAKPDSSIGRCVEAVKRGDAGALVSMGNTGACVGASTLGLGTLEGVRRPGIVVTLEFTGSPLSLVDMGANVAPKPDHLQQYATMGSLYMRDCLGVAEPRVGLLNVGEERGKGTTLLKEAYDLIEASDVRFVGNIEGSDLFRDVCDLVVTDGFTGNVILKLLEHFSMFMLGTMARQMESHGAMGWGSEALEELRRGCDYSHYGGALLLGVGGVVVIGHGRSDDAAVANAIALACRTIDANVNRHIEQGLSAGLRAE